jgi:hypothetical protein
MYGTAALLAPSASTSSVPPPLWQPWTATSATWAPVRRSHTRSSTCGGSSAKARKSAAPAPDTAAVLPPPPRGTVMSRCGPSMLKAGVACKAGTARRGRARPPVGLSLVRKLPHCVRCRPALSPPRPHTDCLPRRSRCLLAATETEHFVHAATVWPPPHRAARTAPPRAVAAPRLGPGPPCTRGTFTGVPVPPYRRCTPAPTGGPACKAHGEQRGERRLRGQAEDTGARPAGCEGGHSMQTGACSTPVPSSPRAQRSRAPRPA